MTQNFKIILGWFFLVMLSPVLVGIWETKFTVSGWMAIGHYEFDVFDGYLRSLKYYIYTVPIVLSIAFAMPGKNILKTKSKLNSYQIPLWPVLPMMMFSIIAFVFDLGITGVETPTVFRLSGIVHYIRSYIFLGIIAVYVFFYFKDRWKLLVIYSLITGFTSGSRFVVVAPIMLMFLKNIIQPNSKSFVRNLLLVFFLLTGFTMVTAERNVLFSDGYTFKNFFRIYKATDFSMSESIGQGVNQLFLRTGLGRDVILANEVQESNVGLSLFRILFYAGGDSDSALYFYGFYNDSERFAIAVPALANVFVSLNSFTDTVTILPAYCLWVFILCKSPILFRRVHLLDKSIEVGYFFQVVFVTIGPIFFAFIIPVVGVIAGMIFAMQAKATLLGRRLINL